MPADAWDPESHLRQPRLTAVRLGNPPGRDRDRFPFNIPALQGLHEIGLPGPVTFFAGENGSGKSTLLEALAIATGLPAVGRADASTDDSLVSQRRLAGLLRTVWRRRAHRGFFLRAEDFFGFVHRLQRDRAEMEARIEQVEREYEGRSELAKRLAMGPAAASLGAMEATYGRNLDANSHGESFLRLFRGRFVPEGLYLLDEPEAALSVQSQLGFIAMMREMVEQGGQFIIATHSPVLMAVPGATIYNFDESPLREVAYDALEGVQLVKAFLQAPQRYMRHLWREEPGGSGDLPG
ncbi:MAG: AAA family ATPase [Gemmatimonadota bacterium]|nr:AAA family ATPase [Gemmatimonadota bacterium]MDE2984301.1 AAA family ATPase [Gemmatimonadota bacterium]